MLGALALILSKQDINLIRGQALDIEIPVKNDDGTDTDLAGATIEFGLASSSNRPYTQTIPTSVSGSLITAAIDSDTSEELDRRQYYYSTWVTIAGESTPVARGTIIVENDSRTS